MGRNSYFVHCYAYLKSNSALAMEHEVVLKAVKGDSNTQFQREPT